MVAWWNSPEKHDLLVSSIGKVSRAEGDAFRAWIQVRPRYQTEPALKTLREIAAALDAAK